MNNKWRYFIIMLLGAVMNEGLSIIAAPYPVWLDVSGTALAALVLEPAAGLIVGLVNNFIIAFFRYDQTTLIYYCVSAAVAVIVGNLVKNKEGKITVKGVIYAILLVIAASTVLSSTLTIWQSGGVSNAEFELVKFNAFVAKGMHPYAACILTTFIIKIYDTLATAVIVGIIYAILPKKLKYNMQK